MRERIPPSLGGHIQCVGPSTDPGMLHRAKYSRFRNESLTPLEEDALGDALCLKNSSSSHSSASLGPAEDVAVGPLDSALPLGALIPRVASMKLANPSTLPSLKNFCLRTKEVPRLKLAECVAVPSGPTLPEITLTTCLATTSCPLGDPEKPSKASVSIEEARFSLAPEDSAFLPKWDKDLGQKGGSSMLEAGVSYAVRYMGCIEVLQSMRSLDFGTRTQVTREAISRLCEAVPGTQGATKKRKPPAKFLSPVLGKSNLQFSGMNIKLTISTTSLSLVNIENQQIIANHHMQSISFASGGDPDTTDYVAYVAKDPVNQRACHILECPSGVAQEVINTIGQAFELRFKQYLKNPSAVMASNEREVVNLGGSTWNIQEKEAHEYYNEIPGKEPPAGGLLDTRVKTDSPKAMNIYENCPEDNTAMGNVFLLQLNADPCEQGKTAKTDASLLKEASKMDLFDDPRYINTQNLQPMPCTTTGSPVSVEPCRSSIRHSKSLEAVAGGAADGKPQLWTQDCYHGKLTRKSAESLLVNDGDFLVRESTTSPGQYVLSGLQDGQAKHLLLVDPEGKVRTKDHVFDSVDHLIHYHMENKLPIISSGSELNLSHPVRKGSGHLQYKK
uniref:SHC-transforming protein 4 isoform X1 n=2 Tax=Pogona vitticeps TaxID=103695 RepID=A0A6J0TBE9_9SAUR